MKSSLRFFPSWNPTSGKEVTGLINLINYVSKHCESKVWCEIGSRLGESALLIGSFDFVEKIHCIDPHVDQDFHKFLEHIGSKIHHTAKKSQDVYDQFETESMDVIYIDGDHSYEQVKDDLSFALRVIKKKGFICGHDYSEQHPGVKQAVNEFLKDNNLEMGRTFMDSSFAIMKP